MYPLLAIAAGGAIGSVLRYLTAIQINRLLGTAFPYGVLVVNVTGCLLVGFLGTLLIERFDVSPLWRLTILVGFLGGYTTMSTFSLDTFNLFEQGEHTMAILNWVGSMILSLLATILGVYLGRNL